MRKPRRSERKAMARKMIAKKAGVEIPRIFGQNRKLGNDLPGRMEAFGQLIKRSGIGKLEASQEGGLTKIRIQMRINARLSPEQKKTVVTEATRILSALKLLKQNNLDLTKYLEKVKKHLHKDAPEEAKIFLSDKTISCKRESIHLDASIAEFQKVLDFIKTGIA